MPRVDPLIFSIVLIKIAYIDQGPHIIFSQGLACPTVAFSQDVAYIYLMSCCSDTSSSLDASSNVATVLYTNLCHRDGQTGTDLIYVTVCYMG